MSLSDLEKKIGYRFQEFSLLEHAMRHSSFCNEQKMDKLQNNERMEFLGDAVLELSVSKFLFESNKLSITDKSSINLYS